jgi:hypothetical protein
MTFAAKDLKEVKQWKTKPRGYSTHSSHLDARCHMEGKVIETLQFQHSRAHQHNYQANKCPETHCDTN